MTKFYLSILSQMNLINGYTYKINGKYVGFALFTKYPNNFIIKGIKNRPFYFCLILIKMVLNKPKVLYTILELIRVTDSNYNMESYDKIGQFLSFGVLDKYLQYEDENQNRIPIVLYNEMITWFVKINYRTLIGKVNKNNKAGIIFHRLHGNTLKSSTNKASENYTLIIDLNKFYSPEW